MKTAILALLVLFFSAGAGAQPYVIGGMHHAQNTAGDLSDTRLNAFLGGGYKVGKFAAEASCAGKNDCSLSGVVVWPIAGVVAVVGKAGAHYLRGSISQGGGSEFGAPSPGREVHWSGWAAGAGIGVQLDLPQNFSLRAMLEQTSGPGELERSRSMAASLLYHF